MKNISNKTKIKLNKKSKISKKQTKRKNKKYLKSVKRIQKGGIVSDEVFGGIREKTGRDFEREFPSCLSLIIEFSHKKEMSDRIKLKENSEFKPKFFWDHKYNTKDEFEKIRLYEDPLGWYKFKNPEFKPVNSIELQVPEFKFIIAKMIKDLLVTLFLGKMPSLSYSNEIINLENIKKIFTILLKIEENINMNYLYVNFVEYMCDYIYFYSGYIKEPNYCQENLLFLKKTLNLPFIILPTFVQINLKKIINLIRAPILNFRLANSQLKIHGDNTENCYEITHDIQNHCDHTHKIGSFIKKNFEKEEDFKLKFTSLIQNLPTNYEKINDFFIRIYNLYNYTSNNYDYEEQRNNDYVYCCILFITFHEINNTDLILDNTLISYLTTYTEDKKKSLLKSIYKDFLPKIDNETFKNYVVLFIKELKSKGIS